LSLSLDNNNVANNGWMNVSKIIEILVYLIAPQMRHSVARTSESSFSLQESVVSSHDYCAVMNDAMNSLCKLLKIWNLLSSTLTQAILSASLIDQLISVIRVGIMSSLSNERQLFINFLSSLFELIDSEFKNVRYSYGGNEKSILEYVCHLLSAQRVIHLLFDRGGNDAEASVRSETLNAIKVIICF
jgi:hypothetical protein